MMTMKKSKRMLPAMKVSEKLHNNYITATDDIQDLRHAIQASLVKKTGRARWSSVNLCAYYFNYSQQYVEKILTVRRENIHN
jgi:hypothetical protein